jgi:hypothetical protein
MNKKISNNEKEITAIIVVIIVFWLSSFLN